MQRRRLVDSSQGWTRPVSITPVAQHAPLALSCVARTLAIYFLITVLNKVKLDEYGQKIASNSFDLAIA